MEDRPESRESPLAGVLALAVEEAAAAEAAESTPCGVRGTGAGVCAAGGLENEDVLLLLLLSMLPVDVAGNIAG